MGKGFKVTAIVLVLLTAGVLGAWLLRDMNIAVLNPKGTIGQQQYDLIIISTLLMLIVVIPVFVLTFFIVWKYRASNTKAKYTPDWDSNRKLEAIWWGLPLLIIALLSVIIWKSSHDLDPYKPLASTTKPLTIQVVALDWKWLFLYPEQGVASVNFIQIPVNTPVNFRITADAPMNSFWIPNLGGQVYAMAGMETKLHLEASETGDYQGSSANISGEGFASMRFTAKAGSQSDFASWVQTTKKSQNHLTRDEYDKLAEPEGNIAPMYYGAFDGNLYDTIIMKYMKPQAKSEGQHEHSH